MTPQMLRGRRFRRLHPRVWALRDLDLDADDLVDAARLALPDDARLTGLTRLQQLGLDFGPRRPVHFVVARDHHADLDGIFLHRTVEMPPCDTRAVSVAAAFVAFCGHSRVVDAIVVGDWLLHREHLALADLHALALAQPWRAGSLEALWVLPHLHDRSRSIKESETRAVLEFAGLPLASSNVALHGVHAIGDLVFEEYGLVVEYEGHQHQTDREQYSHDIGRYAEMRRANVPYVQVTKEKLGRPKMLVAEVYRELLALGYAGPAPTFGRCWRALFTSLHLLVDERERVRHRLARGA